MEIEPENEGFLSRVTRRILNIFSRIIGTFTGRDDDRNVIPAAAVPNDDSRYRMNEIERELVRYNKQTSGGTSEVVRS